MTKWADSRSRCFRISRKSRSSFSVDKGQPSHYDGVEPLLPSAAYLVSIPVQNRTVNWKQLRNKIQGIGGSRLEPKSRRRSLARDIGALPNDLPRSSLV